MRMVFIYTYMAHANSQRSGKKNLKDVAHHCSNQGHSTPQTRNRRTEQIENVLFESDPICTAIHLGSDGTGLSGERRQQSLDVGRATMNNRGCERFWVGAEKNEGGESTEPWTPQRRWGSEINPFWPAAFKHTKKKATCANCALWYSGFPVSDHLFADSPGQPGQAGWQWGGCELTMNGAIRRARHREALTFLGCLLLINSVRWDKIEGRPLLTPQSHTHGSLFLFFNGAYNKRVESF